jgi:CDP-4-dehydro-6-deoxyglucose reductase
MPKWYFGTISRVEPMSDTTRRFWLKLEEEVSFKAGQFVVMDLPLGEKRLQRWRSYSIANAPDQTREFEFCIVNLDGGIATDYFFNDVQIGTTIKFKAPDGTFFLPETIDFDLVMVCTGTGVAPFRSMLWDIYNQNKSYKNLHLIYGTRNRDGILYRDEFEKLQDILPRFSYDIVLSREESWPGLKGYVHQVYLEKYSIVRGDIKFYLCGWTPMIDEAVENLLLKTG